MDVVAQQHLARLRSFVTRARRVEEHSLAADKDTLLAWAQVKIQFTVRVDGKGRLRWPLPDEEALDSLAARCRPFLLQKDSIYHGKVTTALGYFLRGEDGADLAARLTKLKAVWRKFDPDSNEPIGYESRIAAIGVPLGDRVSDRALAYGWLYGDLVHADDDLPDRVGEHDINSRFRAGAALITNVAVLVIQTLNLLRMARAQGLISLDEEAFTEPVLAHTADELPVTGMVMAPVGTPTVALESVLDARTAPSNADSTASEELDQPR